MATGTSVQSYPSSTFVTASFISVLSTSMGVADVPVNDVLSLLIAAAAAAATLAAALAVMVTTGREVGLASEHWLALSKCCCVDSIPISTVAALTDVCSLLRRTMPGKLSGPFYTRVLLQYIYIQGVPEIHALFLQRDCLTPVRIQTENNSGSQHLKVSYQHSHFVSPNQIVYKDKSNIKSL